MKLTTLAVLVIGCCSSLILAAQQTQGTLTNGRIEDMVLDGVSQSEIIRIISTASGINFDLTPGSTDNLLKLGVSEDIIKAMAERENGTPALERPIADAKKAPPDTAVATCRDILQSEASTNKGILMNQHIGGMVLAGVSQSEMIRIISTASAINFDLRPGSTDNLLKVGVSEGIIKAMAEREQHGPVPEESHSTYKRPAGGAASSNYAPTPVSPVNNRHPQPSSNVAKATKAPKAQVFVTPISYRAIPHQTNMTFTLPGHVSTSCYGGGSSWAYTTVSCSSYVSPPTDIPVNISWVEVYNNVTADDGMAYTIKCTAHWIGSACTWLSPGEQLAAEIDGNTMHVGTRRGGNRGRPIRPKFQILDARRID